MQTKWCDRKDYLNSAGTSQETDQNMSAQPHSPSTTVTQTVTSYAVQQPCDHTEGIGKGKANKLETLKNIQLTQANQGGTPQTIMSAKLAMMVPKMPAVKAGPVGKNCAIFY